MKPQNTDGTNRLNTLVQIQNVDTMPRPVTDGDHF